MKCATIKWSFHFFFLFAVCLQSTAQVSPKPLFQFDENSKTRWSSPENINGIKGGGGKENFGAKGRPARPIEAGETLTLLDIKEQGMITRIWITINDRSSTMLRSLRLQMFWDGQTNPSVSVPLGDFFGMTLGRMSPFENALFTSPEGRSFNSIIPMPFRKGAKIQITNESGQRLSSLYFDVDYLLTKKWNPDNLYFHAYWHRDTATTITEDFTLLPKIKGRGKLLGLNVGVNTNPAYGKLWWGEGEIKIYLDGDTNYPTLVGTGTEDYIGDAWGQGSFFNQFTGCPVADEKKLQWSFYRFHIPDPVYFETDIRMMFPQMGSALRKDVLDAYHNGAPIVPTSGDDGRGHTTQVYKKNIPIEKIKEDYVLFYRTDDICSTVYFYLDQPSNTLPPLQPTSIRLFNLKEDYR